MTARDYIKEDLQRRYPHRDRNYAAAKNGADIASAIWEPMLIEAVAHLDVWLPGTALVQQYKEMLGQ